MCRIKKIWLVGLLAVVTLFVGTVPAAYCLPHSSSDDHIWLGGSACKEDGFNVPTDSAIYDVERTQFSYEITMLEQSTMACRYIDTYQMFNQPKNIFDERKYFNGALIINRQQSSCTLLKSVADCCGDWSSREVLIPQGRYSRRGPEKTLNRACLGADRYLHFLVPR